MTDIKFSLHREPKIKAGRQNVPINVPIPLASIAVSTLNLQVLRTEVRGDFNIHGTKYFYNAVFHHKSKKYDVVSLSVPLVGHKTRPLHEMLTRLVIIENAF